MIKVKFQLDWYGIKTHKLNLCLTLKVHESSEGVSWCPWSRNSHDVSDTMSFGHAKTFTANGARLRGLRKRTPVSLGKPFKV